MIDIGKVPFIPKTALRRTSVDRFKISDDENLIAFTVDIGNMERLTAGFKDMKTG